MKRFPRLLLCLPLLATTACTADAIAGPGVAAVPGAVGGAELQSRLQAVKAAVSEPESAPPRIIFACRASISPSPQEPLYIVDGTITSRGDALARFETEGVASIELLKGPNATALYGSRAAMGIVIITTRSASGGAASQPFERRENR